MPKWYTLFCSALLSLVLLSACGTSANDSNQVSGGNNNQKEETAENNDSSKDEANKEKDEQASEEGSDTVRTPETNLTSNGKEETAFLKTSDNQEYSLYVLPEYELTGEEPYKDVLYVKEDDSQFMRIEMLPGEISMEDAVSTSKEQLASVNADVEKIEVVPGHEWLKGAQMFSTKNDEGQVKAYLIEKDGWILKLTIFSKDDQQEDAFLKMAETIEKN